MDELVINFFAQNNDRSLIIKRTNQKDSSFEENSSEFPYGNIILNLFNNVPSVGLIFIFWIYSGNAKFTRLLIY